MHRLFGIDGPEQLDSCASNLTGSRQSRVETSIKQVHPCPDSPSGRDYRLFPLLWRLLIGRIRASFFPQSRPSVANIKSAEKRAEQTIKRRARNMAARSKLRTAIKSVVSAVELGDKTAAAAKLKAAAPIIDSMVNKGVIHRNKASRHKSHLNARVKEMAAE
jgi:small subunit ribosomal protein S20